MKQNYKTILVTGANRGMGLEITRQYLEANWRVIACCRNINKAIELNLLQEKNPLLKICGLNLFHEQEIFDLKTQLADESIDVLFNNAGVLASSKISSLGTIDVNEWLDSFKINTIAPILLAQTLLPQISKSQLKIIANTSSSMGSIDLNTTGNYYIYRSTKTALNSVTKSLAIDLKDQNIIAVALDPGWVKTDMGGPDAEITAAQSVSSMRTVLENLTLKESGTFIRYDGTKVPW